MDLKHLEYIVAIAEEKNISRAADKLFISQPALSLYLSKVEENLGVPLFNRTKSSMLLTYAGEAYVKEAREILHAIKKADNVMEDIINLNKGRFIFGVAPERGLLVIPNVYPEFYLKYPGINIELVQNRAKVLEALTLQGHIDISLFSCYQYKTELDFEVLFKEEIILAVPKSHRLAHLACSSTSGKRPIIDISLFSEDPFMLMKPGNTVRLISDNIFRDAGFTPNVLLESDSIFTVYNTAANISALSLIPETMLTYNNLTHNMVFFSINPEKYYWDIIAAYRKDTYLSRASLDFISMLRSFFDSIGSGTEY